MYKRIGKSNRFEQTGAFETEEGKLRNLIRSEIKTVMLECEDIEEYYDESNISEDEMLYDAEQLSEEETEEVEESSRPRSMFTWYRNI